MEKSWMIEDNSLKQSDLLNNESIFSVANGYIGIRGNFEEGYGEGKDSMRGTYINAFYDDIHVSYPEKSFGFPETVQKSLNVIDAQSIVVKIGNESFSIFEGEIKNFKRYLNLKEGRYVREVEWISPSGKELRIKITRIASFVNLELFAILYEIEKLNFVDPVTIESTLNGEIENYSNENDPRVGNGHGKLLLVNNVDVENDILQVSCRTKHSKNLVSAASAHRINVASEVKYIQDNASITAVFTTKEGKDKIEFVKYNVYTDSLRYKYPVQDGINLLKEISKKDFNTIKKEQKEYLEEFWRRSNIEIDGEDLLQQGLRFNIYNLLQSVGKDDISNITAKGLSGEGYEGHYFWDTEIYMLPFFTLCNPKLAKQLLKFRYSILDAARERAKELGHKRGAKFPWRTISGIECSTYFPAGTAQYHISGDVAYSYIQYYLAEDDLDFVKEFGAEVVMETARLWMEVGHFDKGKFQIDDVTGPDEYTAIVNNNYYTNAIAKYNLKWAAKFYELLKEKSPNELELLVKKIDLEDHEISDWKKAADNMYLPYDENLKINAQDDTFLSKAVWNFEDTPKENYPLLLHYHPLTIYRYQVLKQADTVLAHFLLEDESNFEIIKNSYDYYEKITTHDSSLSSAVYSIMASKIGYFEKAYEYFIETARLDLDNTHGNTKYGLHTANMGGTWMVIIFGFAGLRIKENFLEFRPQLPKQWEKCKFSIQYKKSEIEVEMKSDYTIYRVCGNEEITLRINDKDYVVTDNTTLKI